MSDGRTPVGLDSYQLRDQPILVVDDDASSLLLVRRLLERGGYRRVATTADPGEALNGLTRGDQPDLVILDLHMPGVDGFKLMESLGTARANGALVPFLVLTADITEEAKLRALTLGARDFLTKPVDRTELLLRVQNLLRSQHLQVELERRNETLEEEVLSRTHELELARLETLDRLAVAAEFRDDASQQHSRRIGRTSALLARELGRAGGEVEQIRRAAPLHDIGKIGISDSILLKPGALTDEEREVMQSHTSIGEEILSGSRSPVLLLATEIARTHHERWDGAGYPAGLAGTEIPLSGRIVAVADVFDALVHDRPYKRAWPEADAVREILDQAGRQFDPDVVSAFSTLDHGMLAEPIEQHNVYPRPPPPAALHA